MSDNATVNELVSENTQLRAELDRINSDTNSVILQVESLSDYRIEQELEDRLQISGILLAEGIWNDVLYTKEELKKMYDKFKGKLAKLPMKIEHNRTEEFGDATVGGHTGIEWSDTLGAILYTAEITDPRAILKFKDGTYPATSIKTQLKRVPHEGLAKAMDLEPIDNSGCENPACKTCLVISREDLSSDTKDIPMYKFYGIMKETTIDGIIEDEKESETFTLTEDSVLVLPIEELGDEEEIELEVMPRHLAIKRKRIIYEYLKPGEYPIQSRKATRVSGYRYRPNFNIPQYYPFYQPQPIDEVSDKDKLIAQFGEEKANKLLELVGDAIYNLIRVSDNRIEIPVEMDALLSSDTSATTRDVKKINWEVEDMGLKDELEDLLKDEGVIKLLADAIMVGTTQLEETVVEPVVAPVETVVEPVKVEPVAEPVVVEPKVETVVEPVKVEVKPEVVVEPVKVEVKVKEEPKVEPAKIEVKVEPTIEVVVEPVKVEPEVKVEVKVEPVIVPAPITESDVYAKIKEDPGMIADILIAYKASKSK